MNAGSLVLPLAAMFSRWIPNLVFQMPPHMFLLQRLWWSFLSLGVITLLAYIPPFGAAKVPELATSLATNLPLLGVWPDGSLLGASISTFVLTLLVLRTVSPYLGFNLNAQDEKEKSANLRLFHGLFQAVNIIVNVGVAFLAICFNAYGPVIPFAEWLPEAPAEDASGAGDVAAAATAAAAAAASATPVPEADASGSAGAPEGGLDRIVFGTLMTLITLPLRYTILRIGVILAQAAVVAWMVSQFEFLLRMKGFRLGQWFLVATGVAANVLIRLFSPLWDASRGTYQGAVPGLVHSVLSVVPGLGDSASNQTTTADATTGATPSLLTALFDESDPAPASPWWAIVGVVISMGIVFVYTVLSQYHTRMDLVVTNAKNANKARERIKFVQTPLHVFVRGTRDITFLILFSLLLRGIRAFPSAPGFAPIHSVLTFVRYPVGALVYVVFITLFTLMLVRMWATVVAGEDADSVIQNFKRQGVYLRDQRGDDDALDSHIHTCVGSALALSSLLLAGLTLLGDLFSIPCAASELMVVALLIPQLQEFIISVVNFRNLPIPFPQQQQQPQGGPRARPMPPAGGGVGSPAPITSANTEAAGETSVEDDGAGDHAE